MKKERSRIWKWLLIAAILLIAILSGYYLETDNFPLREVLKEKEKKPLHVKESSPVKNTTGLDAQNEKREQTAPGDENKGEALSGNELEGQIVRMEIKQPEPQIGIPSQPVTEDYCAKIDAQIHDFFIYLNGRDYIKKMGVDINSLNLYKKLLLALSSNPPVPSGEGLSAEIMNMNIFYLFRILDGEDMYFVKEVLRNEADNIEMNIDLFYRYFMLKDQCPDLENTRPAFQVLYRYAGFFLNTIGGRAYLYRRTTALRLLFTYYSIVVIHDADKKGKNDYGIDVFPAIETLIKEIGIFPDLRSQKEYISRLMEIKEYYADKR